MTTLHGEGRAVAGVHFLRDGARAETQNILRLAACETEDGADLHRDLLDRYDGVMLYGNWKQNEPMDSAQENALLGYAIETVDYSNNIQSGNLGHNCIHIFEDTNGDGKVDKFTLFADKLTIPTSAVCVNGGLICTNGPDMIFLKETDGDVLTDVRQSWSNDATPVSENLIKQTRARSASRGKPWTAAELK